jgi:hypothetical protein
MTISTRAAKRFKVAMGNGDDGAEIISAIEAGGNPQADAVAAIGATSNLSALAVTATVISDSDFTAANAAEPTKAEIDAGIDTLRTAVVTALDLKADNADCETLRTEVEARLDAIEAKVDALIAALKSAGLMAS